MTRRCFPPRPPSGTWPKGIATCWASCLAASSVASPIVEVHQRATAVEPDERYDSPRALREALEAALELSRDADPLVTDAAPGAPARGDAVNLESALEKAQRTLPPPIADQELVSEHLAEAPESVAHGGSRHVEALGSAGDAPFPQQHVEHDEQVQVDLSQVNLAHYR